ncbi:MAG: prolyl oligopeptidase family serine peptidase [Patescibacteria group bacterium]|nr:prolyl oligopeptidase family serine peptidase [Patescibacteria group bacterium]
MKKIILVSLILVAGYFIFNISFTAHNSQIPSISLKPNVSLAASPLWYGSIIRIDGDNAILDFRGLEVKHYFSCNIKTLTCSEIPEIPPRPSLPEGSQPSVKSLVRFPSRSMHQNISSKGRFGFYITTDTNRKYRTFVLVDGLKKKSYSIVEHLDFWNLLDEQPHISHFAPDDSTLTYLSDRSGYASLYISSLSNPSQKSFQGTQITSGVSVSDFTYVNPQTILYIANTEADPYNWILYSYNIKTKTKAILADNLAHDSIIHSIGDSIVFTKLSPLGTLPVVLTNYQNGELKNFNIPIQAPAYTDSIDYTYNKLAGANTVEMKNKNLPAGKHPLIVWLHGGPYRQTSFIRHTYISYGVYDWVLEEAVDKGAYVLKVDYPGSYGAGRSFTEKIKDNVGIADVKSVIDTINAFKENHDVSGVYTIGNSYGGYLALKSAEANQNIIDGVLSINGVTDWSSLMIFYRNSIFNTFFSGLPSYYTRKYYNQASIFNYIKQFKNPIYIIQGEVDTTIPKKQAIVLKDLLDKANKSSNLILIPGENHIFLKDSSINTICKTLLEMTHLNATNSCNLQG